MTTHGEPYEVDLTNEHGETVCTTRRAVYRTSGAPTPEQKTAIENVEKVVHDKKGLTFDPYGVMRRAEYLGIELDEEFLSGGKWVLVSNPDIPISTMQAGAL